MSESLTALEHQFIDDKVWNAEISLPLDKDFELISDIHRFYRRITKDAQLDSDEKKIYVMEFWNKTHNSLFKGEAIRQTEDFDKVYEYAAKYNIGNLLLPGSNWWSDLGQYLEGLSTNQSKYIVLEYFKGISRKQFFSYNDYIRLHKYESNELSKHYNMMKIYLNETIEEFSNSRRKQIWNNQVSVWRLISKKLTDTLNQTKEMTFIDSEFLTASTTPTVDGVFNNVDEGSSFLEIIVPSDVPMMYLSNLNMFVFPTYTIMSYKNVQREIRLSVPGKQQITKKVFTVNIQHPDASKKLRSEYQPKDQNLSFVRYRDYIGLEKYLSELRKELSQEKVKDKTIAILEAKLVGSASSNISDAPMGSDQSNPGGSYHMSEEEFGSMVFEGEEVIYTPSNRDEILSQERKERREYLDSRHLKMMKACIPSITRAGRDYFNINTKGLIRKLTGCKWDHAGNTFEFPEPGVGNSFILGVNDSNTGKSFIIKAFYQPLSGLNGNMVEAVIYTELVAKMLQKNMTPHLVTPYAYVNCNEFMKTLRTYINDDDVNEEGKSMRQVFDQKLASMEQTFPTKTEGRRFDNVHLLCIEKVRGKIMTFNDFIYAFLKKDQTSLTDHDVRNVIFQILYTLYVFNRSGLKHNDLHLDNILVRKLQRPFYHEYVVEHEGKKTSFYLKIVYKAYIIDFDGSSVNNSPLLKELYEYMGEKNDPFADGTIINTTTENSGLCEQAGKCNEENPKLDTFKFLMGIKNYLEESNSLNVAIETWISKRIYDHVDKHKYFPADLRANVPPDHDGNHRYGQDVPWMFPTSKILMDNYFGLFRNQIKNIDMNRPTKFEFVIPELNLDDEYKCFVDTKRGYIKNYTQGEFTTLEYRNSILTNKYLKNTRVTESGYKFFGKHDDEIKEEITSCNWGLLKDQTTRVKFYTNTTGTGFNFSVDSGEKEYMVKMNFYPTPTSNGSLVESLVYMEVINHMIDFQMTPHLATPYAHVQSDTFRHGVEAYLKRAAKGEGEQQKMLEVFQRKMEQNINHICRNYEMMGHNTHRKMRQNLEREASLLCIEKIGGRVDEYNDVIENYYNAKPQYKEYENNTDMLRSTLFQIFYTLYIFNKWGLRQNDLHFGNILIQRLDKPLYHKYTVNGKKFYLKIMYKVYIIDFDRASVVESQVLKDMHGATSERGSPFLSEGNIRNTYIDNFCKYYGMACNTINPKVDAFEVLRKLKEWEKVYFYDFNDRGGLDLRQWVPDHMFENYAMKDHGTRGFWGYAEANGKDIKTYYPPDEPQKDRKDWMLTNEQILLSDYFKTFQDESVQFSDKGDANVLEFRFIDE